MVLASLLFAGMSACVKYAAAYFNSAELVCYRGLLGIALLWGLARLQGIQLATAYPGMHFWRSLVGVLSLGAWFYALAALPLATATTLNYMSSVWIAVFLVGSSLLTWNPRDGSPLRQGPLVLTVVAGFVGVVLTLQPTIAQDQAFAGMVGLLSGFIAAFAYLQVTALARVGEPETRSVFYFALGSAVGGAVVMPFTGLSPWSWSGAVWLLPIGVLAAAGQWCMTRAYAKGATLVVANLQYSGILFSAIFGALLFDDTIGLLSWLGMSVIVLSGIAATVLRARAVPDTPGENR